MSSFEQYARYYDLLYQSKDYAAEAQFVQKELSAHSLGIATVLELGCGTGKHAVELAKLGWAVDGIDLSADMVARAKVRAKETPSEVAAKVMFGVGDIRKVRTRKSYDAVVSLFHVMSYQTTYRDFSSVIMAAAAHLRPGGLFFFDFWYGPAVLADPPTMRTKQLEDDSIEVTRNAEPTSLTDRNMVNVKYHIQIRDKRTGTRTEIHEDHGMRYWFLPELEFFLRKGGFEILSTGKCYDRDPLGASTWFGWAIAKMVGVIPCETGLQ